MQGVRADSLLCACNRPAHPALFFSSNHQATAKRALGRAKKREKIFFYKKKGKSREISTPGSERRQPFAATTKRQKGKTTHGRAPFRFARDCPPPSAPDRADTFARPIFCVVVSPHPSRCGPPPGRERSRGSTSARASPRRKGKGRLWPNPTLILEEPSATSLFFSADCVRALIRPAPSSPHSHHAVPHRRRRRQEEEEEGEEPPPREVHERRHNGRCRR